MLLNGCATVFADVGSQRALPGLVGRDALVPANAALVSLMAVSNVAGRGAGGGLVQPLTAPVAVLCTAVSYLASALQLTAMRRTPTPVARQPARLRAQIAEGLRHVLGNKELRRWACTGQRAASASCSAPAAPAPSPVASATAALSASSVWASPPPACSCPFKTGMDNVLGESLRQRMTPDALLGRMNATFRFVLTGALAVGAAVAGLTGELAGVRPTLWADAGFLAMAFLPVFLSPVRTRRALPDQRQPPVRTPAPEIPESPKS